ELGEGVDCVFVWCKEYVNRHSIAPARVDFVRRNLLVLGSDLAKKNIRLHLLVCATAKDIPAQLLQLATTVGAGQLFFNAEYPLDEVERDKRSEERRVGKECRSRWWPEAAKRNEQNTRDED